VDIMAINQHSSLSHSLQLREWIKDRIFNPKERYGEDVDLDKVEICHNQHWTYVACDKAGPCKACGGLEAHTDCIVIAVDGACRNNGTAEATAAAGVFVGNGSKYNDCFILRASKPTNQLAELRAGIRGLEQALVIQSKGIDGVDLHQVVIKADSEYLVKGMTEWAFKWKKNGYRTSRGMPVTNAPLFKKLEELIVRLNELNVKVLFWHVPRGCNKQADMWANAALRNGWTEV
jgi:ribonuclease HI